MQKDLVKKIQQVLIDRGYNLGSYGADGDFGRYTRTAVIQFQKDQKLDIKYPGTVGPKTLEALGIGTPSENTTPQAPIRLDPPWVLEARKLLGLHEVTNAKTLDGLLKLDTSEIPWCGAFTGYIISSTLPNEPLPKNPLGARNWSKFGEPCGIFLGAMAIFWRGSKSGWQGHVGTVVGHDKEAFHLLGGNQSNKISIARVGKDRLLDLRWPITYPKPGNSETLSFTTIGGTLSRNEA
jgi:uncharacterized protein (TIGR02594 family)